MLEQAIAQLGSAAAAALALACLISVALVLTERLHARWSLDADLSGPQKFHRRPTPRIGGVALVLAFVAIYPLLAPDLAALWLIVLLGGLPALLAGLAEDVTRRVGIRTRLAATFLSGALFAIATGYMVARVDLPGVDLVLSVPLVAFLFTAFCIAGVANAVNIIDGFNGLASGALAIMFAGFAAVAHWVGDPLVFGLSVLFLALTAGFFLVNFPHGRLFLGDGGAYFAGYLLAVLGTMLPARNPELSPWIAVLICAYPVVETLSSIWRKSRRRGHSVGQPDRLHLHMLVHRSLARRLVRDSARGAARNPVAGALMLTLPALSVMLALLAMPGAVTGAIGFGVFTLVYVALYRRLSLNGHRDRLLFRVPRFRTRAVK